MNTISNCTFTNTTVWNDEALKSLQTVACALNTNAKALENLTKVFNSLEVTCLSINDAEAIEISKHADVVKEEVI